MSDLIWALKTAPGTACIKIPYKGYEISIAMDDSCGALNYLGRSSICVYRDSDGRNVNVLFDESEEWGTLPADAETLKAIFHRIDAMEKI